MDTQCKKPRLSSAVEDGFNPPVPERTPVATNPGNEPAQQSQAPGPSNTTAGQTPSGNMDEFLSYIGLLEILQHSGLEEDPNQKSCLVPSVPKDQNPKPSSLPLPLKDQNPKPSSLPLPPQDQNSIPSSVPEIPKEDQSSEPCSEPPVSKKGRNTKPGVPLPVSKKVQQPNSSLVPPVSNDDEDTETEMVPQASVEDPGSETDVDWSQSESEDSEDEDESNGFGFSVTGKQSSPKLPSKWTWKPHKPAVIPFTGVSGLRNIPQSDEPIDYFFLLFSDELVDLILEETNRQAQILASTTVAPKARIRGWKPLTRADFEVFLGLLFLTGQVQAPSLTHYWQTNAVYSYPLFRNAMSTDRFRNILRLLSFAKPTPPGKPKPEDPLYEIQTLLDLFHKQMSEIYYPSKELCLDESMLLLQGQLYFRHYIQRKKHKHGIKLYSLTEPNGLILKTAVFYGAAVILSKNLDKLAKGLLNDFLGVGHSVYLDKNYAGLGITEYLLNKSTYCTGTLKANRKDNPMPVVKKKLKPGEVASTYTTRGICVLKWFDKVGEEILISSEHGASLVDYKTRSCVVSQKPKALLKYIKNMGGIDQLLAYYPCKGNNLPWHTKVAIHIFHIIMNNAFLLHGTYSQKKLKLLEFRDQVISSLIYKHRKPLTTSNQKPKAGVIHIPKEVPRNARNRKVRKRCVVCLEAGMRVESHIFCNVCPNKPGLCLKTCFAKYHKYEQE